MVVDDQANNSKGKVEELDLVEVERRIEESIREIARLETPRGLERVGASLLLFNYAVSFLRVQDLPGLSWIGGIKFPAIIATVVGLLWLCRARKNPSPEGKMLIIFLSVETIRLIIGKFFDPQDTFVRNDFWQFQTIKDLLMQFSGLALPAIVFLPYRRYLGKFVVYSVWLGGFLGLWSVTHAGRGPGGFLGDENDFCLALLYFMGFAVAGWKVMRGGMGKAINIFFVFLILAGIIATESRGGFLGLVALCGTALFQSRYKMRVLAALFVFVLIVLPFIPHQYVREVESIKSDFSEQESTITERLETWKLALKVWLDPPHILTGVGLQNTQWWFPNYEPPDRVIRTRSLAGRATHSMYFQVLGDLGVWGIVVFFVTVGGAYLGNRRTRKEIGKTYQALNNIHTVDGKQIELLYPILGEIAYLDYLIYATNCAWVAVLVAGIGISVLYYPPIWTLLGFSVALRWYWQKLFRAIEPIVQ